MRNQDRNLYILDQNVVWDSGIRGIDWESDEFPWLIIDDGHWFISCGVCWDGATGVPDGPEDPNKKGFPISWLATLIHDIGYLMLQADEDFPYSRKQIDLFFKQLLKEARFKLYNLYYFGVRVFGGLWSRLSVWFNKIFNVGPRRRPIFIEDYCNGKRAAGAIKKHSKKTVRKPALRENRRPARTRKRA
jgi:hypothetical protein